MDEISGQSGDRLGLRPFGQAAPSGKPQPPRNAAYETEGNAATSNPAEEERAAHHHGHGQPVARRAPGNQSPDIRDAVSSRLGRGAATGEEERFHHTRGESEAGLGDEIEIEGDTMRAPGEGRVADAVGRKPGASGSQPDLAGDLDR
ncbi:hypothetical protein F5Y14DRAFT_451961 [Nemania sp. NC0429]|nr:hypothetical protein F5Y14DRAFT_451961 [Nemania sp. NC0429]